MYSLVRLQFFLGSFFVKNIEILCLKIQKWFITYLSVLAVLYCVNIPKKVNCASHSKDGTIEFGLINTNLRKNIADDILATAEYWVYRLNEMDQFRFCSGRHFFAANRIYPEFFVCPHAFSFFNHEPLHIFKVDYKNDWKIQFRVLNDHIYENSNTPIFAGYMSCDPVVLSENLSYEVFYKLIKILDLLRPISSESLNKFYSSLYRNGLMNSIVFADIVNDAHNYRTRYFNQTRPQEAFMYFFGVLNPSLDACFIPNISVVSIFRKRNQCIDQCFRYTEEIQNLVLKISADSLELLMATPSFKMAIFNWLLLITKISGFYFDNTECSFNPIKCPNVCGFIKINVPKKSPNSLKAVSSTFLLNLSDVNKRRIAHLRFVNVDFCFDKIQNIFKENNVSYFEVAYCSVDECHKITEFLLKMTEQNIFKLRGVEMKPDDVDRILRSKVRILVLDTCTICKDTVWTPNKSPDFEYEIIHYLQTLNVSSSKLPSDLMQLLLHSFNLENLNISCFEFLPANSSSSMIGLKRKWNCLQIDKYIPSDYLKNLLKEYSVYSLSLCESFIFNDIISFFNTGYFNNSVKTLDLSDNSLTVDFLAIIDNFKNLKRLNLSASLPLSIYSPSNYRFFATLRDLDVSRNNITSTNFEFLACFTSLRSLNISESKIERGLFTKMLTVKLIASLVSLDLSGVHLEFSDFKRFLPCKKLKCLYFKVANDRSLSYYVDILVFTAIKKSLNVLNVEIDRNISIDDLVSLNGLSNLSEVKIISNAFLLVGEENLIKFDFFNPEFRLELCLRHYNLDMYTIEILKEMFQNYSFSIISE
ncbi:hypothetical protein CWI39_1132p0010 [Hamiltosporidium magnivora]|uniref:Leucine-rich repeat-containing protein n=1 Tax=Hamiltosporidium magnivora TaxID=148818 RepID=A0A4V2JV38_9MICR|nr:hypothetical protein CWI39_1132p0010 [Hamiltosporidium magnivora]